MARRMYSIDQINSDISFVAGNGININNNTISLSLYQHNISIFSLDDSLNAYMTVYSVNSAPVTTKQELVDNILMDSTMPATGTAESLTKLIYAINAQGELLYTDMAGNQLMYTDDYTVVDEVVSLGG